MSDDDSRAARAEVDSLVKKEITLTGEIQFLSGLTWNENAWDNSGKLKSLDSSYHHLFDMGLPTMDEVRVVFGELKEKVEV